MPISEPGFFRFDFRPCNVYRFFSILGPVDVCLFFRRVHPPCYSFYLYPSSLGSGEVLCHSETLCTLSESYQVSGLESHFRDMAARWRFERTRICHRLPKAEVHLEKRFDEYNRNGIPGWLEALSTTYSFVIFTFGLVLPSTLMIYCYSRVIYHMWFNVEANRATNVALLQSRRKLTKLFILVTIIFLVTWTPTFTRLIAVLQFVSISQAWKFELLSLLLGLAGSTVNPVIYSLRCPRFQQEVVTKLLAFRCCKGKRQRRATMPFVTNRYSLRETKKTCATIETISIAFGV